MYTKSVPCFLIYFPLRVNPEPTARMHRFSFVLAKICLWRLEWQYILYAVIFHFQ